MTGKKTKAVRDDAPSDLIHFLDGRKFGAILADPPWQFQNRTGIKSPLIINVYSAMVRWACMT